MESVSQQINNVKYTPSAGCEGWNAVDGGGMNSRDDGGCLGKDSKSSLKRSPTVRLVLCGCVEVGSKL